MIRIEDLIGMEQQFGKKQQGECRKDDEVMEDGYHSRALPLALVR